MPARRIINEPLRGRVDVALLRVGELVARKVEGKLVEWTGTRFAVWDGPRGLEQALTQFCGRHGLIDARIPLPGEVRSVEVDIVGMAQHARFIKGRRFHTRGVR